MTLPRRPTPGPVQVNGIPGTGWLRVRVALGPRKLEGEVTFDESTLGDLSIEFENDGATYSGAVLTDQGVTIRRKVDVVITGRSRDNGKLELSLGGSASALPFRSSSSRELGTE